MAVRRTLPALLFGLALLCQSGDRAVAQQAPEKEVEDKISEGIRLFEAGHFPRAAKTFAEVYQATGRPEFLYAQARAENLAGDCPNAVRHFEAFLATDPSDKDREAALEGIAGCSGRSEEGEEETDSEPAPPKVEAKPPRENAVSEAVDAPEARRSSGTRRDLRRDHEPRIPWFKDAIGLGLAGVAIGTLATGGGFYLSARSQRRAAADAHYREDHALLADSARQRATIAGWLTTAGGAIAVAAGVRLLWLRPKSREDVHLVFSHAQSGFRVGVESNF